MKNHVWAEVVPLATPMTLNYRFAVKITSPIEMPFRVYEISAQEVMVAATSAEHMKYTIFKILQERVLVDYNQLIEDSPILDMCDDPSKYQTASWIEFTFPNENNSLGGTRTLTPFGIGF